MSATIERHNLPSFANGTHGLSVAGVIDRSSHGLLDHLVYAAIVKEG